MGPVLIVATWFPFQASQRLPDCWLPLRPPGSADCVDQNQLRPTLFPLGTEGWRQSEEARRREAISRTVRARTVVNVVPGGPPPPPAAAPGCWGGCSPPTPGFSPWTTGTTVCSN